MARTVTILSIDGGGVRGLIPALVLHDLTRRVRFLAALSRRRSAVVTGRDFGAPVRAHRLFDLVAGTSTGALIALALVHPDPCTAEQAVDIYRKHAAEIFPPSRFSALRAVRQAFSEKYDANDLVAVLKTLFGDVKLSECISNVLVAAYDSDNRAPFFFRHADRERCRRYPHLAQEQRGRPDYRLVDVARATTAAPTYFEPALIESVDGGKLTLLDGGLTANNPALHAYVEARRLFPEARRFVVVSLGTGKSGRHYPYDVIRKWGYFDWISPAHGVPLTTMMWDGQSESVAEAFVDLPGVDYFRFNIRLERTIEDMDDARPATLARIEKLGRRLVSTHKHELHILARLLYRRRVRWDHGSETASNALQEAGISATG